MNIVVNGEVIHSEEESLLMNQNKPKSLKGTTTLPIYTLKDKIKKSISFLFF